MASKPPLSPRRLPRRGEKVRHPAHMRETFAGRGRGNTRPRYREAHNSRQNSSRAFRPSHNNNRNIARAQDFHGAYSGSPPDLASSKWDVAPAGLENYTAEQVKLVGIFAPGKPLPEPEIKRVFDKLSVRRLDPEHSALNRSLIIEGNYKKWCYELFDSIGISTSTKERGPLVEFETPKHVAVVLACPGPLVLKRPPGLVTSDSSSIWSNHATRYIGGDSATLAPDATVVRNKAGDLVAQFCVGGVAGTCIYPELNDGPVSPQIDDLDQIPSRAPTRTLVILNGEDNSQMRSLLDSAVSIVPIKQNVLKIFAHFETAEKALEVGTALHLQQVGKGKLLCAFWDDEAFKLGIY